MASPVPTTASSVRCPKCQKSGTFAASHSGLASITHTLDAKTPGSSDAITSRACLVFADDIAALAREYPAVAAALATPRRFPEVYDLSEPEQPPADSGDGREP